MKKKKLTKVELLEIQRQQDKKFRKYLLITFSGLLTIVVCTLLFYTYGCNTRLWIKTYTSYGNTLPPGQVCFTGEQLSPHETKKVQIHQQTFYVCSERCLNLLKNHFREFSQTKDPLTQETINKANAVIGLQKQGSTHVLFFKSQQHLKAYYNSLATNK
ncbi:hypothetical protein KEM09_14500 [Carboxylicivirga mesophila]|uniref:TRASH domain-containing protein n=1 Tax=Carboxylicivirga mesophila TaxID=1166478 RepID=A0ABS5KC65_9BACT|nr:hypothetical protein [Carboxylicivirga mesophila]MBS2212625.1 hypothetical protein [Carboxylicivirga mesophila]